MNTSIMSTYHSYEAVVDAIAKFVGENQQMIQDIKMNYGMIQGTCFSVSHTIVAKRKFNPTIAPQLELTIEAIKYTNGVLEWHIIPLLKSSSPWGRATNDAFCAIIDPYGRMDWWSFESDSTKTDFASDYQRDWWIRVYEANTIDTANFDLVKGLLERYHSLFH